jgi:hypothetical protein
MHLRIRSNSIAPRPDCSSSTLLHKFASILKGGRRTPRIVGMNRCGVMTAPNVWSAVHLWAEKIAGRRGMTTRQMLFCVLIGAVVLEGGKLPFAWSGTADGLRIENLLLTTNAGVMTIGINGTRYSVERTVNLTNAWTVVGTMQFGNSFTSSLPTNSTSFWRLTEPVQPTNVPSFVPGSWTLVVLPDTQIYTLDYPELFRDQARWIVANKNRYNIKYVLHEGDFTNDNSPTEWANSKSAMSILDGQVPYAVVRGNHDGDLTSNNFPAVMNFPTWPTFGGLKDSNTLNNSYHLFSAGGTNWLLLALEFDPSDSTLAWANQVASNYPSHKKILLTHEYLESNDARDLCGGNIWRKLVNIQTNFTMVTNGHILGDGLGYLESTNQFGDIVHQMVVNYQTQTMGGGAYLRLIEFLPDGKTVQVKAYSPYYGTYYTDSSNQFQFTLQSL